MRFTKKLKSILLMKKLLKQGSNLRLLMATFFVFAGFATIGQVTVKGKVTGENGKPIGNVSVQISPGNSGGVTDANGNYNFLSNTKPGKYSLMFSGVGLKTITQQINVSANQTIENDAELFLDPLGLDEVVVTGYGTPTRKKQIVNSISTVSGKELSGSGAQSIDAAMQGKVAGAQINQNSGNPAGGMSVRLRGPSTIAGSSEPLYIVDGVIVNNDSRQLIDLGGGAQNRLVDINMNDVDRIEVIKGAAAAAIYGSRASNGVVQIFTKKGKEGVPQFSFSTSLKSSSLRKKLETNEVPFRFNSNSNNLDLSTTPVQRYDYQDLIYRNAFGTENNLSVSGGSAGTRYFASGSNFYNQGIIRNTDFNRNGLRLRLNQKVGTKVNFSVGANYVVSSSKDIPNGGINSPYGALTGFIFANNFVNPAKDPVTGIFPNVTPNSIRRTNPLEAIDRFKFNQRTNRITTDINFNYKPIEGLAIDITTGFDNYTQTATAYIPPINTTPTDNSGLSRRADATVFQTNTDLTISYNKAVKNWLQSTTVLGGTVQYDKSISFAANANTLGSFGQTINNGTVVAGEDRSERSFRGVFLQQTFGLNDKLFINAAGRFDGSSVFAAEYAKQFYPKVGASYIISNENFWKGISNTVSFMKIRAAWGKAGNLTALGSYERFANYGAAIYGSQTGYIPSTSKGNEGARPEKQIELEVGFDANLFNDRVTIEFNYFTKKVEDLLLRRNLSPSTGFSSIPVNIGNSTNKGIEFLIKAIPVKNKNVEWSISVSYLNVKNKVTNVGGDGTLGFANGFGLVAAVNGEQLPLPTQHLLVDLLQRPFRL